MIDPRFWYILVGHSRIDPTIAKEAAGAAARLDAMYTSGKNPAVMAAALLCVVSGRRGARRGVQTAEALNVSPTIVRQRAGEMEAMV